MNRFAGIVVACLMFMVLCGFGYAAITGYIKGITVEDKGDHGEVKIAYNTMDSIEKKPSYIEEYHDPVWIPEGYYIYFEKKIVYIITLFMKQEMENIGYHIISIYQQQK